MAKKTAALLALLVLVIPGMSISELRDEQAPEFFFTRLVYGSGFRGRGFGGSWATDYPEADVKFMWGVQRMTGIRVYPEPNTVRIMDPNLFKYPFLYSVEVGYMNLNEQEAERLREYCLRGGFWYVDDFWGTYEWQNFATQIRKVFPDRKLAELPMSHEVFHTHFDVKEVMQIPNVGNGCRGGPTWERDGYTPHVLGISDDNGRLMVLITYNSDLGDAWEWMDQPCYPELFSGTAYRMGINFIIYAMTH
jgi:hypothetical protein